MPSLRLINGLVRRLATYLGDSWEPYARLPRIPAPTRRPAMKPSRLIALAATAGSVGSLCVFVAVAPRAIADAGCGAGGPPPGAASKDISDVYGQPATLWMSNLVVGITTPQGYGEAAIPSPSPLQRRALLI